MQNPSSFSFEAIGTQWQIDFTSALSQAGQTVLRKKIAAVIEDFDVVYSRFRPDSLITTIAHKSGIYVLPANAELLFHLYRSLYDLTHGAFTPLIGQLLVDAGYDAQYSLQPKKLAPVPKWDDVMTYTYPRLLVNQPVLLDFGAGGKGYLVDLVSQVLQAESITDFCVDAGGDMVYRNHGGEKLRVGLEHPTQLDQVIGVAEICNQSICGSSGNRRAWGKFHHIMHPKTLAPARDVIAAWAIADTGLLADAMATALFLTEPKQLQQHFAFEYACVHSDFSLEHSPNFPAEFFTTL